VTQQKARLEGLLVGAERSFKQFADLLNPEQREGIQQSMEAARAAITNMKLEEIQQALERLSDATKALTDVALYDPKWVL
jgi:hypothetical protein